MSFKYPIPLKSLPKTIPARRKAVLKEMVKYYSQDPAKRRSFKGAACAYRGRRGCRCAIGRWIPDHQYQSKFDKTGCGTGIGGTGIGDMPEIMEALPKQIQALGKDFLVNLQDLHDKDTNWGEKGLSLLGVSNLNDLV
jgi:hypothetical protein